MADAVRFIKISKKDKNGVDKTISLQSLSEITIPYVLEMLDMIF